MKLKLARPLFVATVVGSSLAGLAACSTAPAGDRSYLSGEVVLPHMNQQDVQTALKTNHYAVSGDAKSVTIANYKLNENPGNLTVTFDPSGNVAKTEWRMRSSTSSQFNSLRKSLMQTTLGEGRNLDTDNRLVYAWPSKGISLSYSDGDGLKYSREDQNNNLAAK